MPTFENLSYGPHERNVLDFWQAKSEKPTPVVVYIHGGGFRKGSKERARTREADKVKKCLANGVSVASINYQFKDTASLDLIILDCARAIQFLRYKAKPWLAVHDDLADPKSKDPVLRESSRLAVAGHLNSQATYDTKKWADILGIAKTWRVDMNSPKDPRSYGVKNKEQLNSPKAKAVRRKVDMPSFMDAADPPLFLYSPGFDTEPTKPGDVVHHPRHAKYLKKKCDQFGIEAVLVVGETPPEKRIDMLDFFFKHLK